MLHLSILTAVHTLMFFKYDIYFLNELIFTVFKPDFIFKFYVTIIKNYLKIYFRGQKIVTYTAHSFLSFITCS